ncbi:murein hydrolase activator EnvC family protein [Consotaella salsifontis]|uniref:murein hydrolase activator EnvC family protein n=1 Tax=Consotaella salsifontis TaxID=1365950 RepID=UPI0010548716|nr:peptidoglycan DD-metalloendopeptidase family protein [Consotaella salsifontis]
MLLAFAIALATPAASPMAKAAPADTESLAAVLDRLSLIEEQRAARSKELDQLSEELTLTGETVRKLDEEVAALAEDREKIRTAIIDAAAAQQQASARIGESEQRIGELAGQEASLKSSLLERRGLLAEVLAALERMGRAPPPALLVKPDDALGSVRSAILLGAVVPSIRTETQKLADDLSKLASVRQDMEVERQRFVAALTRQREEEARLKKLSEEKERLEAESRDRLGNANRRAQDLAAKATSLNELIASLDADLKKTRAAEDAARQRAEEARLKAEEEQKRREAAEKAAGSDTNDARPEPSAEGEEPSYDIASLRRDMMRIDEPAAPFSTLKGRLSAPVTGGLRSRFGAEDSMGRPASGETYAAAPGALVTAPADASVLYAGAFRSYGQLLILDAGDGYHIVLAGLDEIDVDVGQFVLTGEPVGAMGAKRLASAASDGFDAATPSLYVEFRKDGNPVDPSPWWTAGPSGRTRNDP